MADLYSDTPLAAQEQAIKRRQQIAESLMAQGQTPLETNQMAGGYVVPVGVANVLGKLAQSYFGAKTAQVADDQYGELANKRKQAVADAMSQYNTTEQGTPAVEEQMRSDMGATGPMIETTQEAQPAVAGNPRKAVMDAMMSQYPELQRYAAVEMANQNRKEDLASTQAARAQEAQLAREARAQELELRLQDARTSNADRLAMQKELAVMNHDTQVAIANQASEDRRFAINNRAQSEPAPSMTEVLDPKDPSRMLRVDARTYQGGTVGSQGVLGVSGKEPTAAKREEKLTEGKAGLSDTLDALEAAYGKLDKLGGIVSTKNSTLSNLGARARASGAGQFMGGATGTEEQTLRDEIRGTIPLLVLDIKNATGASAQQMNSNVELQNFMRAASDPKSSLQANLKLLKNLKEKYVNGNVAPKDDNTAAPTIQEEWVRDANGKLVKK